MSLSYVVTSGDCLSSIAARFGFADWRTIYEAPENADFKARRPNPNLIYPGDVVIIPAKTEKSVALASGASHRVRVRREPTHLRVGVEVDGTHRYLLEVGGQRFRGTTRGESPIEHVIQPEARRGLLRLWPDTADAPEEPPDDALAWSLDIGALDPVEEVSGVQGRLSNLGYYHGPLHGEVDELTSAAIRWFQADSGHDETGEIDQQLRDALVEAHDGS